MAGWRFNAMWRVRVVDRSCLPAIAAVLVMGGSCLLAQQPQLQPMGSVATRDARVTGGLEVGGELARLMNNASVTAYDRTAAVALSRGGHVLVCSTSEFHLLHSGTSGALIFGLDRGALEIYSGSEAQDVVLTPDLKLTPVTKGSYDLRVRVTREGDTCVENAGAGSPVINVADAFSPASYRILPGQHVLFVGGDLHKVVDQERSPCGCPSAFPSMLAGQSGTPAAAAHPFPEAESQGLAAATAPGNAAPVGTAGSQVTTTFSYDNGQGVPPPGGAGAGPTAAGANQTPPNPSAQHGFGSALRRFFHRIFHPNS